MGYNGVDMLQNSFCVKGFLRLSDRLRGLPFVEGSFFIQSLPTLTLWGGMALIFSLPFLSTQILALETVGVFLLVLLNLLLGKKPRGDLLLPVLPYFLAGVIIYTFSLLQLI